MGTYRQLTEEERYLIAAQHWCGASMRAIALVLGRAPSTISRELRRNATTRDSCYRAQKAHSYAVARRRRCRRGAHFSAEDMARVSSLLRRKWSAEQVSGYLKRSGELHISHETIYRRIRWDKRSGGDLWRSTRIMSKFGRKRYRSHDSRGVLAGKRSIAERPAEAEHRQRIGHWEGDTVMGSDMRHCVLTLVERKSGFALVQKLNARTKEEVTKAASRAIARHERKFKTLTLDNGTEFHDYKRLEQRFTLRCYFAAPYHSWERGSNENFNGLLRQYLPKGTCLRTLTQARCNEIADDLNNRLRKRLGFSTPAKLYYRH